MKKLPISIFLFVMLMAFVSAFTSYKSTSKRISEDVNNALALTKYQMPCDVVSADTIRCYRNNITIAELRETACLAMRTVRKGNRHETELIAEANCDFATVFMLSDQRASASLMLAGILWLIGSTIYMGGSRCRKDAPNVRNDYNDLYREDPLITLGLFGYCGYSIVDNNKTRLTPFVGFGLLGYYYTPEDEGSSMGSGNGCFHFGIIYNHIFHNQVSFWGLNNDYYNADHSKAYIDVRLYGTYNNFKSIVGAPQGFTLNLQVGFAVGGCGC